MVQFMTSFLFHSAFFFSLALPIQSALVSSGNTSTENDRLALLAIKSRINHAPHHLLTSWNQSSLNFCNWQGVTCGRRHQRVVKLILNDQGLAGSLSPFIGNLTFLRVVNFGNNSFQGEIPQEIGRLHRLNYLNLSHNSFVGRIPVNISQCTNLTRLYLEVNKLVGEIPAELGSLQMLLELVLEYNNLTGVLPPFIGNYSLLQIFSLAYNSFQGEIPPEIGRLHSLTALSLYTNSFVGRIPVNISQCTNLKRLYLGVNKLVGEIPAELGSLETLVELVLECNNLTGVLPPFIGNHSLLQVISVYQNSLGGSIPDSVSQMKSLTWFGLAANMFSGTVPSSLYNISSLTMIDLASNQLTGRLPQYVILPNLQTIAIGFNDFSGTIPVSLFNASGLQTIDMVSNKISGKVPIAVGSLKFLQWLNLGSNRLGSGENNDLNFLSTLTNCTNLQFLSLHRNHFGGLLPNSIANLSDQLSRLYIGQNQLHGIIPYGICKFVNLIALGFSDSLFTGHIPFCIGMLNKLQALDISGNRLSGQLPTSIRNLSSLFVLDLSSNMLEGKIISAIAECKFLEKLYLSYNNLNGIIPEKFIGLSSGLRHLDLSHNSLVGHLPLQLGNFIHLQQLDVSRNKMSGDIPSTIGDCSSLEQLSLKENFFSGSIPKSFGSLISIRSMDLSMNNFSGEIPKDLQNLTLLQDLNLSFNNFNGAIPTEGVFKNASKFSINGNYKLCGGIAELGLHTCHIQKSKKGAMSPTLKVTLGVVISSILIATFVTTFLCWNKKLQSKPSSEPIVGPYFERVSYRELYQATNGFSPVNLIGWGSFGSVYMGILDEDEGHVAIKVLNLTERGAFKSFTTECDALRKIRHRNLLKIITICSSVDFQGNDFKALVLKFMSNGNLERFLHPTSNQTRALSLLQRINIAIDIASALDYLHNGCETTIIHCDLKPNNVLLDQDMIAHVSDFGLAKILPNRTSNIHINESNSTSPKGTIGYIPPEYGTGAEVSKQGDVYSFGILLLELLTGKRPTDDAFKDGLTLHVYSCMALPLRVMDIIDHRMLLEDGHDEVTIISARGREMDERVHDSIVSLLKIGIACSVESQSNRIEINDALSKLKIVKEVLIGARMCATQNLV